jgi:hypothetical protein
MAFPLFQARQKSVFLPELNKKLESVGYQIKGSFTYRRPDQFVGREILVLNVIPAKLVLDYDRGAGI